MKRKLILMLSMVVVGMSIIFVSLVYAQNPKYVCIDPKAKSARLVNNPGECRPPLSLKVISQQDLEQMTEDPGRYERPGVQPPGKMEKETQGQGGEKRARFRVKCRKICYDDVGLCIRFCCFGDYSNCQIVDIIPY